MAVGPLTTLLQQFFLKRTPPSEVVKILKSRERLDSKALLSSLLEYRKSFCPPADPLPPRYLAALLLGSVVSLPDTLVVFVNRWNLSRPKSFAQTDVLSLEEITVLLTSPDYTLTAPDTTKCLLVTSKWLTAVANTINQNPTGIDTSVSSLAEVCGSLLATFSGTTAGVAILSAKSDRKEEMDVLAIVNTALELAIGLFPGISAEVLERLGMVQKHIAMVNHSTSQPGQAQQSDLQSLQFQAGVSESQVVPSKAGTSIFLETILLSGKTLDDNTFLDFLGFRHNNDQLSMFRDLFSSSFQILKKSFQHGDPYDTQISIYIRNKLPSLLANVASSPFATFAAEEAFTESWPNIDSDLKSSDSKPIIHRFLHVSGLNTLISPEKRDELIGDSTAVSAFSPTLQTKEDIVAEVNSGNTRPMKLVKHLITSNGSAAAIAQAIVEIILTYCQKKETHNLKDLANALTQNPSTINARALFIRPSYWISPLCSLLDEWRWDEIHGESQPLYDEFGSILLLILATKRRLVLTKIEFGCTNQDSFVSKYLAAEGTEQALEDLNENSQKQLGEWINALYIVESLNDELTTACSPQEFYLLIPTLIRQSLLAKQSGQLNQATFKSGLEFFLEPFLLPSLVSALTWLNTSSGSAAESISPILSRQPETEDAKKLHETILSMTNSENRFALDLRATCSIQTFKEDMAAVITTGAAQSSIPAAMQSIIYIHGLEMILTAIVDVLLQFTGTAEFLTGLDVASIVVCTGHQHLRDMLRLKNSSLATLLRKNQTLTAEVLVHLHRRVDQYASMLVVHDMGMNQFTTLQLSNMEGVAANIEIPVTATQELPQDHSMDDIDQVLNESAVMGNTEQIEPPELSMDDFYGLQGDMTNLDDLDLEMFS